MATQKRNTAKKATGKPGKPNPPATSPPAAPVPVTKARSIVQKTFELTPELRREKILIMQHDEKILYAYGVIRPTENTQEFVGTLLDKVNETVYQTESEFDAAIYETLYNITIGYFAEKAKEVKKILAV